MKLMFLLIPSLELQVRSFSGTSPEWTATIFVHIFSNPRWSTANKVGNKKRTP